VGTGTWRFQISSRLSLSSANTLVAPTASSSTAMVVAVRPEPGTWAPATRFCSASAPVGPTSAFSWAKIAPWAAWAPRMALAAASTRTRIGAMENRV
jgi:hypothetical protein